MPAPKVLRIGGEWERGTGQARFQHHIIFDENALKMLYNDPTPWHVKNHFCAFRSIARAFYQTQCWDESELVLQHTPEA